MRPEWEFSHLPSMGEVPSISFFKSFSYMISVSIRWIPMSSVQSRWEKSLGMHCPACPFRWAVQIRECYAPGSCFLRPRKFRMGNTHGWALLMPSTPFLPFLWTQKILAGLEHKNGEIKPKSRRRWGLVSRSTKDSDDWDDLDDLDFSPSLTRIDLKNKKRQSDETLCRQVCASVCEQTESGICEGPLPIWQCFLLSVTWATFSRFRFESVLDLKPSEPMGTGNSAPTQTSYQRRDTPTLRSSAKQHYLKHSRYLPGNRTIFFSLSFDKKPFPRNPMFTEILFWKALGASLQNWWEHHKNIYWSPGLIFLVFIVA